MLGSPGARRGNGPRRRWTGGRSQAADAGTDVHDGQLVVRGQRLYNVAALPAQGAGRLRLHFDSGISAYSFTFGYRRGW